MVSSAGVVLQTPTPGLGVDELSDYGPLLIRLAWFAAGFLATVAIGWFVVAPGISGVVGRRNQNNPTLQEAISRYVRLLVILAGLFVGAGVAGFGRALAASAIIIAAGTLAVGVGAQSVIGSLVSGLVLVLDPEFNVGDYIRWEDREGEVRSITLRVTRVVTPDGELVTIPNTVLTRVAVTRPFGRGRYRLVERVGIAFEDDVEAAIDHLEAAALEVDAVLDEPAPAAYVEEFGSDAVVVLVQFWLDRPRQRDLLGIRSAFARAAKRRLDAAGITISPATKRELLGRIGVEEGA